MGKDVHVDPVGKTFQAFKEAVSRLVFSAKRQSVSAGRSQRRTNLGPKKKLKTPRFRGPAVYAIFTVEGELLRIGSSGHAANRVIGQMNENQLIRQLAESESERLGIERNIRCKECDNSTHERNPAFTKLIHSMPTKFRVAFFSIKKLKGLSLTLREFEGILLWATRPPLNSEKEIENLLRG